MLLFLRQAHFSYPKNRSKKNCHHHRPALAPLFAVSFPVVQASVNVTPMLPIIPPKTRRRPRAGKCALVFSRTQFLQPWLDKLNPIPEPLRTAGWAPVLNERKIWFAINFHLVFDMAQECGCSFCCPVPPVSTNNSIVVTGCFKTVPGWSAWQELSVVLSADRKNWTF